MEAPPEFQLDVGQTPSPPPGSGGPDDSGNGICIEPYEWWYDIFGYYHEEVTGPPVCFHEYEQ